MPPHTVFKGIKACIPVLHQCGYQVPEICDLLGIHKSLVYQVLQYQWQYGLTYDPSAQLTARCCLVTPLDITFICLLLAHHHTLYLDEL